ncbi:unnamed protein product [Lactuca saligna]|uniref:RNA helicase n=1 Tax=Lactuca saligna TaxID=75948 RepID=A0AA35VWR4_LACSI|nr:unnamed protein product [Lactuca saligna]
MDIDVDRAPDTQKIVESSLSVEVYEEAIVMAQGYEPNMAILPDAEVEFKGCKGELGFDYLRDNLAGSSGQLVMRWPKPFHFAIDDKVDYVLIDEGRNPFLISGEASKDVARYLVAAKVVELVMRGLVILETIIAETSVTIPGIKYVIDPGLVKVRSYSPDSGIESLVVVKTSKAQALQRRREGDEKCFLLYPESGFEGHDDSIIPKIKRGNLSSVIFQLNALGVDDILGFDIMEKPDR